MPELTIGSIVEFVGGDFHGDRNRIVRRVRTLSEATEEDLSFLANPKYVSAAHESGAAAILVGRDLKGGPASWIRVDDPYYALARVLEEWFSDTPRPKGVSSKADVAPSAKLGQDIAIGPFVTIGENVEIGQGVTIHAGSSIGDGTRVGDDTLIHSNVSIYHGSRIGNRCIIHSGAVVGSDGFGFATFEGTHHKVPQVGIVRLEDDVEVGAGTTIDRGALGETVIGKGTKIDNLVQIAHNVKIGRHCFVAAQVGIAGSTEIGDYCSFGGQSGVTGHVTLASKVMVAGKSAVMKSVREAVTLAGSPARPLRDQRKQEAMIRRLPKFIKRLEALEEEVAKKNGER